MRAPISDTHLLVVYQLVEEGRAVPAIIVRHLLARLAEAERRLQNCGAAVS